MKADDAREAMNAALAKWHAEFPAASFEAKAYLDLKIADAARKGASSVEIEDDEFAQFPGLNYEHNEMRDTFLGVLMNILVHDQFEVKRLQRGFRIYWGPANW
jgi:hypothetical protein